MICGIGPTATTMADQAWGCDMRCLECGAEIAERAQVCARCRSWAPAEYQLYVAEDRPPDAAYDAAGGLAPTAIHTSVGQQRPKSAPDPEADGAVLAEWVETRAFSTTRLRPGYDIDEVDAFLRAIRDTFLRIREPSLTPDEIRKKQFSTTRLRPGYDEEEVDAFLDEAESRLAAQVGARREVPAAAPESGSADPAAEAVQTRCLECGAESAEAVQVCGRCGAPVAQQRSMPEAVPADAKRSRAPQAGIWAMVVGAGLSAFCAYAIVLNVHAFLTQGTPAQVGTNYETPGILVGNIALWGVVCLAGLTAAIWGFRRRRHSRADQS